MDASQVVTAYHELWRIEEPFRMTESDLAARPVFHRKQEAIEAQLTVVFAPLAYLQDRTVGWTSKRLLRGLRSLQSVTITIADHQTTAQPRLDSKQQPSSTTSPISRAPRPASQRGTKPRSTDRL